MVFCGYMGDYGYVVFLKNFDLCDVDYIFSVFICWFKSNFCVCVRELDYQRERGYYELIKYYCSWWGFCWFYGDN